MSKKRSIELTQTTSNSPSKLPKNDTKEAFQEIEKMILLRHSNEEDVVERQEFIRERDNDIRNAKRKPRPGIQEKIDRFVSEKDEAKSDIVRFQKEIDDLETKIQHATKNMDPLDFKLFLEHHVRTVLKNDSLLDLNICWPVEKLPRNWFESIPFVLALSFVSNIINTKVGMIYKDLNDHVLGKSCSEVDVRYHILKSLPSIQALHWETETRTVDYAKTGENEDAGDNSDISDITISINDELYGMAYFSMLDPKLCMKYAFLLGAVISHEMSHVKMRIHNKSIESPVKISPVKFHKESGVYVEDRLFGGVVVHEKMKKGGDFSLDTLGIEAYNRDGTSRQMVAKYKVPLKDIATLFSKEFWLDKSLDVSSVKSVLITTENKFDSISFKRAERHKMALYSGRVLGHDEEGFVH